MLLETSHRNHCPICRELVYAFLTMSGVLGRTVHLWMLFVQEFQQMFGSTMLEGRCFIQVFASKRSLEKHARLL